MDIFAFPFHKCRTKYPDSGAKVQFGRGWVFAATPEAPPSREFTLTFKGMTYFVESDGKTIDENQWPSLNMKRLENFYLAHQTHKSFWYEHPVWGFMKVRFLTPIDIPDVHEGGGGVVEELTIQFKEVPGLVGLEYPESIPPPLPRSTYTYITRAAEAVRSFTGKYSFVSVSAPPNAYEGAHGDTIPFVFTISRAQNLDSTCQVTWTLSGTVDASDFVDGQLTSGDIFFDTGETTKTITINVKGDVVQERSESLRISIDDAINCYLDIYSAQCFVLNDDGNVGSGPTDGIITENGDYIITENGDFLVWQ